MKQRHLLPILLTWLILVALLTLHLRDSTLIPSTISQGLNGAKGWKSSFLGDKADDAANAQAWSMENNRMACDYCPHPTSPRDLLSPHDPLDLDLDSGSSAFCHSIGEHNLARSIAYEGSSSRIHRLLAKLNSGRFITVGVLGGSVSAGHGLYASGFPAEREGEGNMHWRVFDWLRKRWPVREGEAHRFVNGAVAGTGTDYFSACFAEHIPEDSDLVLMEFAINDMRHTQSQDTYERLLRGVLDLPSKPAVINMHVFGLMFDTIVSGGSEHLAIAQYYDSPVINLRNLALPMILSNASTRHDWFFSKVVDGERVTDLRHLGPYGHQVMANLTTLYLERQLCKMNEMNRLREKGIDLKDATQPFLQWDQLDSLPPQLITASYDPDRPDLPTMSPQCMTTNSEIHPLVQETQEGFTEWAWKEKKYLVGREPGARIKIKFHTVLGTVNLFYQKSASYGLGMVMCWVDDDKDKLIVLDAYWPYTFSIPVQNTVRNDLTQGEHLLTCEILPETSDPTGGHEFRITTLTSL